MKRLTIYLMTGIFSIALLTACGGGGNNNTEKQDTSATATDTTQGETANNTETTTKNEKSKDSTDNTEGTTDSTAKNETDNAGVLSVEGTFTGLDQGDLFYFNIKDANGKDWSFTVQKTDSTYDKVSEKPTDYVGKKVKVFYKKEKRFIENAGGDVEMEFYEKAEFIK